FQAEDGIRDFHVTGVQTCALPISWLSQDLTTLNVVALDTTEKNTDVVASLTAVEVLLEHFNASHNRLLCWADTDDFNFVVYVNRSEERRVGKEWRSRRVPDGVKPK